MTINVFFCIWKLHIIYISHICIFFLLYTWTIVAYTVPASDSEIKYRHNEHDGILIRIKVRIYRLYLLLFKLFTIFTCMQLPQIPQILTICFKIISSGYVTWRTFQLFLYLNKTKKKFNKIKSIRHLVYRCPLIVLRIQLYFVNLYRPIYIRNLDNCRICINVEQFATGVPY